jgi:hypothetical protein
VLQAARRYVVDFVSWHVHLKYLFANDLPGISRIDSQTEHEERTFNLPASLEGHRVLDSTGLLGVLSVEVRQQMQNASGREITKHSPQVFFRLHFFHDISPSEQTGTKKFQRCRASPLTACAARS